MPARNSIFTGRYPHETGVTTNDPPEGGQLAPEFVFMGTYLRNAGYTAAYCGKWHVCLNSNDQQAHGFDILQRGEYDSRTAQAAVEFLHQKHKQPFLLVVSLLNPHDVCEWARRLAGRKQTLSCGEIGTPPVSNRMLINGHFASQLRVKAKKRVFIVGVPGHQKRRRAYLPPF